MRHTLALWLFVLCACGFTNAQQAPPAYDPQAAARAVAPFVDELTIVVARVDLTRLDPNAMLARVGELLGLTGDRDVEELRGAHQKLNKFLAGIRKAGARDMFAVISLADLPKPSVLVFPLYEGADPNLLGTLLTGKSAEPNQPIDDADADRAFRETTTVIGSALVMARPVQIRRLRAMAKADPRPELAKAFAAAGETTAQVLILPTNDARRVIEEMLPELPAKLGGGPSKVFTRGLLWAAIGADPPPKTRLQATIQSESADAARALAEVLGKVLRAAVQESLGGEDQARKLIPELDKHLAALTPTVTENRLALSLGTRELEELVRGLVLPPLQRSRQQAQRAMSASNIHLILKACIVYLQANKDVWPPDLQTLVGQKMLTDKILVRPDKPDMKDGYVYLRPGAKFGPQQMVVYERHDAWPGRVNVGFADGHVEAVGDEARFKELLAKARPDANAP